MARTRSKPAPKEKTPEPATSTAKPLPPSDDNAPKLFVLPKGTSRDARIVTLDNPASGAPSRYFFCPEKGFYEFTRIAAPKKACKSWLIAPEKSADGNQEQEDEKTGDTQSAAGIGSGYISKSSDLFVATPIDLLFLLLPALAPKSAKETKQHFLALDDHIDTLSNASRQWKALIASHPPLKQMIEKKMDSTCDTVDAGDETMYRLSHSKLLPILLAKASRMSKNGLPASLEERFVKTAFDIPIMNIKREESRLTEASTTTDSQDNSTTPSQTTQPQGSAETTLTTPDDPPALSTPPAIPSLLRLRISLTYLLSAYTPATLRASLQEALKTNSNPDFTPLDTHLAAIAKLKAEALALRSISDNISRKRGLEDDDEKIAEREEKKRKKEEEEKKKKSESRGIKQLKKADTSGMKKLSSFFAKAPPKKT